MHRDHVTSHRLRQSAAALPNTLPNNWKDRGLELPSSSLLSLSPSLSATEERKEGLEFSHTLTLIIC